MAGKPVVGVGMQMEQVANLACLERLGFATRVAKSKNPSRNVQAAIEKMLSDEVAKAKAAAFAEVVARWTARRKPPLDSSTVTGREPEFGIRA